MHIKLEVLGYPLCVENRIRELRLERARQFRSAFSAAALASRLGIDPSTLRRWERGGTAPTRRHARALARELGVTLADLGLEETKSGAGV